jgi:general secretion pathway protein B
MSYILQALKKSEQERELAASQNEKQSDNAITPITEDTTVKQPTSSWVLYSLYLALLAVMLLILWQILLPGKAIVYEEIRQEARVDMVAEATSKVEKVEKVEKEEVDAPVLITPQAAPIAVERAPKEVLSQLPNMEITSHIFSTDAERRSIVVNGERLVEGDFIAANVQLKNITAKGMVIDIQGWSLLVGRSRGWGQ